MLDHNLAHVCVASHQRWDFRGPRRGLRAGLCRRGQPWGTHIGGCSGGSSLGLGKGLPMRAPRGRRRGRARVGCGPLPVFAAGPNGSEWRKALTLERCSQTARSIAPLACRARGPFAQAVHTSRASHHGRHPPWTLLGPGLAAASFRPLDSASPAPRRRRRSGRKKFAVRTSSVGLLGRLGAVLCQICATAAARTDDSVDLSLAGGSPSSRLTTQSTIRPRSSTWLSIELHWYRRTRANVAAPAPAFHGGRWLRDSHGRARARREGQ